MADEETDIPDPDRIFEQVSGYKFDSEEYKKMLAKRRVKKITFYEDGKVKEIEYVYTDMDSKKRWPYYYDRYPYYDNQPWITSHGASITYTDETSGGSWGGSSTSDGTMYTTSNSNVTFHPYNDDDDNGKGTVNA